jgi:hypothetical protein
MSLITFVANNYMSDLNLREDSCEDGKHVQYKRPGKVGQNRMALHLTCLVSVPTHKETVLFQSFFCEEILS